MLVMLDWVVEKKGDVAWGYAAEGEKREKHEKRRVW